MQENPSGLLLPKRMLEVMKFERQIILVRCFVYEHVVRCGAVFIAARTPPMIPIADSSGQDIVIIQIPELFANKIESVMLGDGGESGINAKARMLEFDIFKWLI